MTQAAPSMDTGALDRLSLQSLALDNCIHEIRKLLVAGSYARMLAQERAGALTDLQKQYLEVICENAVRIREVLVSLSWVAEPHAWNVEVFSLRELVCELEQVSGLRTICTRVAARPATCILGDRRKLREALLTLVDCMQPNACGCTAQVEAPRVCVVFSGIQSDLANHLQVCAGMPKLSALDDRLEDVRHILRLHGACLSLERTDARSWEATVSLPVAQGAPNA